MIVICTANKGSEIPENFRYPEDSNETDFSPLEIGEKYNVYGMLFRSKRVDYLVCPSIKGPGWMPGNLFEIFDHDMPTWSFRRIINGDDGFGPLGVYFNVIAMAGYPEIVNNCDHYDGILERDPVELEKFYKEKFIIDQWSIEKNGLADY